MMLRRALSATLLIALLAYCDGAFARYIEADPIGLRGGINSYAYALGNPMLNIDPLGLDVTIGYFPGQTGHVGIAVNSTSTYGLYPLESPLRLFFCGNIKGRVLPDQATQDALSQKRAQYLTIHTTPTQDAQIQLYIDAARNNSNQTFNLCSNQCTNFARNALQAGGVPTPGEAATDIDPQSFFGSLQKTYGPKPANGR